MSGSYLPTYRPVILQASAARLSTAELVARTILIFSPTAACRKCEQIDSYLHVRDEFSLEDASCRPSTR